MRKDRLSVSLPPLVMRDLKTFAEKEQISASEYASNAIRAYVLHEHIRLDEGAPMMPSELYSRAKKSRILDKFEVDIDGRIARKKA